MLMPKRVKRRKQFRGSMKGKALRLATHKLPCKCKVVSRADLEGGVSNEN